MLAGETFCSGLKRVTGSTLSVRKTANRDNEASRRVLPYALHPINDRVS